MKNISRGCVFNPFRGVYQMVVTARRSNPQSLAKSANRRWSGARSWSSGSPVAAGFVRLVFALAERRDRFAEF